MAKHLPPKDGLVRASRPSLEVRAKSDGEMPKLTGYAARFDEPTEINSVFEGRFQERIAPGAFKRTLKNSPNLRIIFNHGHDPHLGEKPLAEPRFVEDETGLRYDEPQLFDAEYVRELLPALEAGQFGSSFKFRVVKESFDEEPEASEDNPDGIPERVLEEIQLYEAGPVVFPAYAGATAGAARALSLTDREVVERAKEGKVPELVELFTDWVREDPERVRDLLEDEHEISPDRLGESHSDDERDAGERTADDVDAQDKDQERETQDGPGMDHSVATTQERDSTEWWTALGNDDDKKEWQLP